MWKYFPANIFWLFQPFNEQQHPAHEGSAVCEAHEAEEQHCDEGRVDGPLHQQGHTGKGTELLPVKRMSRGTVGYDCGIWEFLGVDLPAEAECLQTHAIWMFGVAE